MSQKFEPSFYWYIMICIILDRHHVWQSHDPTSVQIFQFSGEKKNVTPPFFVLHLICTKSSKLVQFCQNSDKLSSTWLTLAQPGSTLLNLAQLFCSHLFTFGYPPSYLPNYLTSYLPTYLPAYPSGSLMLPNLTISLTLYYITK